MQLKLATLLGLITALGANAEIVSVPQPLVAALEQAVLQPGARAQIIDYRPSLPPECAVSSVELPPIAGSARIAVRLAGVRDSVPCTGWAWVKIRVLAPALIATRAMAQGESLSTATTLAEREIVPGHQSLSTLPSGAVASRAIPSGTIIETSDIRTTPAPGDSITVVARAGAIRLEQPARVAPCTRGRTCAVLPSGKRVEGRLEEGRLVLETP